MDKNNSLSIFESFQIRRVYDEVLEKWYFSIVDVVMALTESANPTDYLKKLRKRDSELGLFLGTNCPQVEMISANGVKRKVLAGDTEQLLRVVQSVPSPKAEPLKLWLAKVGYERVQEIENPERAAQRMRTLYKMKGYSADWIEMRMRGITIREELTDEWQKRGANKNKDYEILTAEISEATFGIKPSEYKNLKGLKRENLRDHMDDFELIFTMLGERATKEIHVTENSHGLPKLKSDAQAGGKIAGEARLNLEKRIGRPVVTPKNYLNKENNKQLK
jgi:hypothetical protein